MVQFKVLTGCFLLQVLPNAFALKIGFVGDTGAQTSGTYTGKAVYDMFREEGVDLVLQNGDLDYDRDPTKWDNFLNAYAGNMDVLVSSGNHEEQFWFGRKWYGSNGYKAKMYERMSPTLKSQCTGSASLSENYGEYMTCEIDNSVVVMLGWAQLGRSAAVEYVEEQLSKSNAPFKFCAWHEPEGKLNSGNTHTGNNGHQAVYEACRKHGAMITSGHSHVYGRSKMITGFSGTNPVISSQDAENPTLDCGTTVSIVVGMGGYKFDGTGRYSDNFRSIYTKSTAPSNKAGGLICDTGSGDQTTMDCFFKLTTGEVHDRFVMTRAPKSCTSSNVSARSGSCEDNTETGLIYDDGRQAKCPDLANFCDRVDVSSVCAYTCGRCGSSCKDIGGLKYNDGGDAECSALLDYCEMEVVQESCAKTCGVCGTAIEAGRTTSVDRFEFENVVLPFSVQAKKLPATIENPNPTSEDTTLSTGAAIGIGAAAGAVGMGIIAVGAVLANKKRNEDNVLEKFAV